MLHGEQAQAQGGEEAAPQHQPCQLVGERVFSARSVLKDFSVELLPVVELLQLSEFLKAIDVGLPCEMTAMHHVFFMKLHAKLIAVLAMPSQWLIHFHNAAHAPGLRAEAPVVDYAWRPGVVSLCQFSPHHHGVSLKTTEDERWQFVGGRHDITMLQILAPEVGRECCGMVADCADQLFYLGGKPHIVLVAYGNEVCRGTLTGGAEIDVYSCVFFIDIQANVAVLRGIFLADSHRGVGGHIVLDDDFLNGIGLAENGVELLPQVFLSIVGAHDYCDCC